MKNSQQWGGNFRNVLCMLYSMAILFSGFAGISEGTIYLGALEVQPELTVSGEYDDNINLKSGQDPNQPIIEDFVWHVMPKIPVYFPYNDHLFSLEVAGDYRQGTSHDELSDLNTYLTGNAKFDFPMGLKVALRDKFSDSNFDNAIYKESGISKYQSNISGISSVYTIVERFKIEGDYYHEWVTIEGGNSKEHRNRDNASGKFSFPLVETFGGYVSYIFEKQKSDENEYRNYNDNRFAAGVKWEGPYRFSAFLEAGHEKIDFELTEQEDYSNPIVKGGIGIKLSESSKYSFAIGRDGYENTIFENIFEYISPAEDFKMDLSVSRSTVASFSQLYPANALKITDAGVKFLKQDIFARFALALEGNYQIQDSFENEMIKDYIYRGKISLSYPIREWLNLGTHYQYTKRDSEQNVNDYENNRVGVFGTLLF